MKKSFLLFVVLFVSISIWAFDGSIIGVPQNDEKNQMQITLKENNKSLFFNTEDIASVLIDNGNINISLKNHLDTYSYQATQISLKKGIKSDVKNGVEGNPLVGNWYSSIYLSSDKYPFTELYIFRENMTYTYLRRSNWDSWNTLNRTDGTYSFTKDKITFISDNGNETQKNLKYITPTELGFDFINYADFVATTLTTLDMDIFPSEKESAVIVNGGIRLGGGLEFVIKPFHNIDHYYFSLSKDSQKGVSYKATKDRYTGSLYQNLELGTLYYITVTAYDKNGTAYKPCVKGFISGGEKGMINYLCGGKTYNDITTVKMTQSHWNSGTGTGANYKFLEFISADKKTHIKFAYAVKEWESINKIWDSGTYKIEQPGGYHKYSCSELYINGSRKSNYCCEGYLYIKKKSSNYWIFDIILEDVTGHFEGSVV